MTFAPTDPTGLGDLKKLDRLASSAVLDAVIRNSPTSVTVVGADDRIVLILGGAGIDTDTRTSYVGRKLSELVPDPAYLAMAGEVRAGGTGRRLVVFGARTYDTTAALLPDAVAGTGCVAFIATDVTDRLADSRRFQALNRLHSVLSETGTAMVRAVEPGTLLAEVCRILVTTGEFAAAAFLTHVSSTGHLVARSTCHSPAHVEAGPRNTAAMMDAVRASYPASEGPPRELRDPVARQGQSPAIVALFPVEPREDAPGVLAVCVPPGHAPVSEEEHHLLSGMAREIAFALDSLAIDLQRATAMDLSEKRAQQQSLVSTLGVMALGKADPVDLFDAAVASLEPFGQRQVILYEALTGGDRVLVRATSGASVPVARGDVMTRSVLPVTDTALISGNRVRVDDFSTDPRFVRPNSSPLFSVGSGVSVPIRVDGETVAALTVHSFAANDFDSTEVDFYDSVANVISGAMERSRYENSIRHDATHDRLTGLPNRLLLQDRIAQAISRCRLRQAGPLAVLLVDLDVFKEVNDHLGHETGDRVLTLAGTRLRDAIRPSDTLARLGGDEFVVLCEDLLNANEAATVARRITERLHDPFVVDGQEISVTASVGVAVGSAGSTHEELLRDAAAAMYRAKQGGRDRFELFDEALRTRLVHRADIELGLRHALDRDEFVVAYQPILEVATGEVREAEALLRWTRPDGSVISPAEFIPIAEETGMIVAIGAWVMMRACEDAVRWNARFGPERAVGVGVNLSARQIGDPNLLSTVIHVLHTTGLAPDLLRLEITETALMEDAGGAEATLEALNGLGVQLSVDDFGTGYSSLMYLRRFPVRILKVDRYFVAGLGKNPEDDAIVQAVIALAHSLGLSATAEGVETLEQLHRLRVLGCDSAQGFLWSKAIGFSDFVVLIEGIRASGADPVEEPTGLLPVSGNIDDSDAGERRMTANTPRRD